jgi:hypothetical protein
VRQVPAKRIGLERKAGKRGQYYGTAPRSQRSETDGMRQVPAKRIGPEHKAGKRGQYYGTAPRSQRSETDGMRQVPAKRIGLEHKAGKRGQYYGTAPRSQRSETAETQAGLTGGIRLFRVTPCTFGMRRRREREMGGNPMRSRHCEVRAYALGYWK